MNPETYMPIKISYFRGLAEELGKSLPKGRITPEKFEIARSFSCTGEIFPGDRDNSISAKFHIRFFVVDSQYQERSQVYLKNVKKKDYLVFGKNARYVTVGKKTYSKKTALRIRDRPGFAYSESESMRFNFWWKK